MTKKKKALKALVSHTSSPPLHCKPYQEEKKLKLVHEKSDMTMDSQQNIYRRLAA